MRMPPARFGDGRRGLKWSNRTPAASLSASANKRRRRGPTRRQGSAAGPAPSETAGGIPMRTSRRLAITRGRAPAVVVAVIVGTALLLPGSAVAAGTSKIVEAEDVKMPRMAGPWLVYHVGRKGQHVWNLKSGEKVAEIRQWRPLPYDVNERHVLSVSGAGTWYRYDLEEKDRRTHPMRRIADLEAIRLGHGGGWFIGVTERYDKDLRRKRRHLRMYRMNGRPRGRPMTRDLIDERFDVAGNRVVWSDQRVGGESGVYLAKAGEGGERIGEAMADAGPWTDGRRVVWIADGQLYLHDIDAGETTTPLAESDAPAPLAARVAGDRLVVLDEDWAIRAYPLEGGAGRVVVDPESHGGMKALVGVGAGRVVWRAGDGLWSAPLEDERDG